MQQNQVENHAVQGASTLAGRWDSLHLGMTQLFSVMLLKILHSRSWAGQVVVESSWLCKAGPLATTGGAAE